MITLQDGMEFARRFGSAECFRELTDMEIGKGYTLYATLLSGIMHASNQGIPLDPAMFECTTLVEQLGLTEKEAPGVLRAVKILTDAVSGKEREEDQHTAQIPETKQNSGAGRQGRAAERGTACIHPVERQCMGE